jgi:metal-responsive CopG/Arc/MetJ family transcriptional regulator
MSRLRLEGRDFAHFGLYVPREFLKRLDAEKGPYYSRNKYVLKILEQYLNENEQAKNLQGSRIGTPASQAEATTTPTQDATAARTADNVIGMTTNGGRRTGDVDANGK